MNTKHVGIVFLSVILIPMGSDNIHLKQDLCNILKGFHFHPDFKRYLRQDLLFQSKFYKLRCRGWAVFNLRTILEYFQQNLFKSVFRGEGNPSWNGQAEKKYEHSVNNNSHTFGSVQGGSQNNKQTNKRKIAQMQVY